MKKNSFVRFTICVFALLLFANFSIGQPSSDYRLIYSDEFDDGVLDWRVDNCLVHGTGDCEESMFYMKENVTETDGRLVLTAKRENKICGTKSKEFTSGQVLSPTDFLYGYFEIKAKVPEGNGFWPAFWFWTGCSTDMYREIDVFEFCGCDCSEFKSGFFYENDFNGIGADHVKHAEKDIDICGNDACEAFHTYGVEWTPSKIAFYLDGNKIISGSNPYINIPMPAILNLAINGCWSGCGWTYCGDLIWNTDGSCHVTCGTSFPAKYEIDYFKVWKKQGEAIYINGPKQLCINQIGTYYAPMIPGATYTWSSPTGLQINLIPWDHWGCNPAGVHKQVEIRGLTDGIHRLNLTVSFPSGYSETQTIDVKVDSQVPSQPTGISFTASSDYCCYYVNVSGSNDASSYIWNINSDILTSTPNTLDECLYPGFTYHINVKAANGCGESVGFSIDKYLPNIEGCDKHLRITPNPNNGYFKVEVIENEEIQSSITGVFKILDLNGNEKLSKIIDQNESIIDGVQISNGTYYAVLINEFTVLKQIIVINNGL